MDLLLKDKVALVTGAGRHIGKEVACALAHEGSIVIVNDYYQDRADAVVNEINKEGRGALGIQADVRDNNAIENMVKQILDAFGRIDILVNNAGILPEKVGVQAGPKFTESTRKNWEDNVDVNMYGTFICTKTVLINMVQQKYGKVINISSEAGVVGQPGLTAYSAVKAGIIGFTKALAKEVGKYRINVNCIAPGFIPQKGTVTDIPEKRAQHIMAFSPIAKGLGRFGSPADIAWAAAYLASDRSEFITGQVITINGGFSMV